MEGSVGTTRADVTVSARTIGTGHALGGSMMVATRVLTTEPSACGNWW
jgi:hypothetical protein